MKIKLSREIESFSPCANRAQVEKGKSESRKSIFHEEYQNSLPKSGDKISSSNVLLCFCQLHLKQIKISQAYHHALQTKRCP